MVQLHLDPPDPSEISGINQPLSSFAVAFQEIAAAGHPDKYAEREGGRDGTATGPADPGRSPIAQRSFDNPDRYAVCPDILPQETCSHRFDRDHVSGIACGPDAERTNVCPDVENGIASPDIVKPVFGNLGNLPERGWGAQEFHAIPGRGEGMTACTFLRGLPFFPDSGTKPCRKHRSQLHGFSLTCSRTTGPEPWELPHESPSGLPFPEKICGITIPFLSPGRSGIFRFS
jgi:hypothetical protein